MKYKNWRIWIEHVTRQIVSEDKSSHAADDWARNEKDKAYVSRSKVPIACAEREPDFDFPNGLFLSYESENPDSAIDYLQKQIDEKEENILIVIAKRGSRR